MSLHLAVTGPRNLSAAAALAVLAADIEASGSAEHAARARAIVADLGFVTVGLDGLRAGGRL